jgi:hypothetical protein
VAGGLRDLDLLLLIHPHTLIKWIDAALIDVIFQCPCRRDLAFENFVRDEYYDADRGG